jgi:3-hydroxyisobutyrate dehydrogenase-like beta-hydroxyacid dehydrogenase
MITAAVLGTGLMGSAVARQLLRLGCRTVVWNRTAGRAEPLLAEGAELAATPQEAMRRADVLFTVTATTAEMEAAVAQADEALAGKDVVNLVTATPAQARALGARVAAAGAAYISGTIQCYPSMIGGEESVIIYGGDGELWERRKALLLGLAGGSYLAGDDAGRPNVIDSGVTGAFLFTCTAASLEAARYALLDGMSISEFRALVHRYLAYLPSEIDKVLDSVEREDFTSEEAVLDIYARSLEMFSAAFANAGAPNTLMGANLTRMKRALAAGDGGQGFAALYRH